ncbi:MAG TPA: hypothetical protein VGF13_06855 [Verrucomicrobiae bacterium]
MFIRGGKWLVVLALVITTGGHWFLLQSAAWVGMAVSYSQSDSFATALKKTFDGDHPCNLCKMVKAGKASEKKRDLERLDVKFEFTFAAGTSGLFPPRPIRHFTPQTERAHARADAPLPPPPRFA